MGVDVPGGPLGIVAEGLVEDLPAFNGHVSGFLDGGPEAVELAREVFQRGFNLPPQCPSAFREEEVTGNPTYDRSYHRRCHRSRCIGHTRLL